MRHPSIGTVSEGQLRAWADSRVISAATYVDEIDRRRRARLEMLEAPPLDYELDVPGLEFDPSDFAVPVVSIVGEDLDPFDLGPRFTNGAIAVVAGGMIVALTLTLLVVGLWSD